MGSGNVLKTIIKIVKDDSSKQVKGSSASTKSKGSKCKKRQRKTRFISRDANALGIPIEDLAAIRIQTAFWAYRVEWSGGPDTKEEILTKIQTKEAAAVKRERTMAYAFSHQWRAPKSINNGISSYKLANANWGWSWVERWIAVWPWERWLPTPSVTPKSTPKKPQNKQTGKAGKNSDSPKPKASLSAKPPLSNGKGTVKPRRLSYPGAEKPAARRENTEAEKLKHRKRRENHLAAS
ncbi:protein IQ-DOMAIN 1-like [Hibiscus syriacus]|uniref:protein IQ-DOMAIN 1-like n=1 Tax=Hibiscus syriacus TaxID=106335 RepID=UPI001921BDE9|nr:protein IQ-DOMAIN 1-like [Hibiscus syriacus]